MTKQGEPPRNKHVSRLIAYGEQSAPHHREIIPYDIAHDLIEHPTASVIIKPSALSPYEREQQSKQWRQYRLEIDSMKGKTHQGLSMLSPTTATLLLTLDAERGTPFFSDRNPHRSSNPAHSTQPKHHRVYNKEILFKGLKHYLQDADISPSRLQLYRLIDDTPTNNRQAILALTVPVESIAKLEEIQQKINAIKKQYTERVPPSEQLRQLKQQARSPASHGPNDLVLFDLALNLEPDLGGNLYVSHIDAENRDTPIGKGYLSGFTKLDSAFFEGGEQTGADSLSNPADVHVSTLMMRINPFGTTRIGTFTRSREHMTPMSPKVQTHFLREQFGRPLTEWMKKEGATDFKITLHETISFHPNTPKSCILRISVNRSDIAATLCLGKIANALANLEQTLYSPTKTGGRTLS